MEFNIAHENRDLNGSSSASRRLSLQGKVKNISKTYQIRMVYLYRTASRMSSSLVVKPNCLFSSTKLSVWASSSDGSKTDSFSKACMALDMSASCQSVP